MPDTGHFEDLGLSMYHIEWEIQDIDTSFHSLIDQRILNWSKFPGLHHFGKKIIKILFNQTKLTAKEYGTIRCLTPFIL